MSKPATRERRGTKRKLALQDEPSSPAAEVKLLVESIRQWTAASVDVIDRPQLRKTAHQLAEYCKTDELVEDIVKAGTIDVVVPLLQLSDRPGTSGQPLPAGSFDDVEKEACFILGLLAVKPEYQAAIASQGALPGLVALLQRHAPAAMVRSAPGSGGVARRAADAITNLAHENVEIKHLVRQEGGVPPLVSLLEAADLKVQRAAAGALRTLAFKNEENKVQIVEQAALPVLIQMLRSEDVGVHYEAVGVIGNLVHSSSNIKRRVLEEGALQPVINLLSSPCPDSQREAALLLGQFATTEPEFKARICQRGAVAPLICMLTCPDVALKEMAAFALGRLAQNSDNQAGIVQAGGLVPLLELLESKQYNLQHNAAFALYGLSDNEDNVPDVIKEGGLQRLMECSERLQVQASKDCVQKTITRIQNKLAERRVLHHVAYALRSGDRRVQQRAAMALARLAPNQDLPRIFAERGGLDVLLEVLTDATSGADVQREAAGSLLALADKVSSNAPVDAAPQQPTKTVYLGEEYVNNKTLADVTFMVQGTEFYAHRIALLASSDAFRAMFNSGYREREAASIDIPNIPYDVFGAMMAYIYTGQVDVTADLARDLLAASDQYLLEGLKRLCEGAIAQSLSVDTLADVYALSEAYSAPQLGKRCVLFALEHYDEMVRAAEGAAPSPATPPALSTPTAAAPAVSSSGADVSATATTTAAGAASAPPPPPASGAVGGGGGGGAGNGHVAYASIMRRMVPLLKEQLLDDLSKQAAAAPAAPAEPPPAEVAAVAAPPPAQQLPQMVGAGAAAAGMAAPGAPGAPAALPGGGAAAANAQAILMRARAPRPPMANE